MLVEGYKIARKKKHGAGASIRLGISLALIRWYAARKKHHWFFRWYLFKAPIWIKTSGRERSA